MEETIYDPNKLTYGNCIAFTPDAIRDEIFAWLDTHPDGDDYVKQAMLWAELASVDDLEAIGLRAIAGDSVWVAFVTAVTEEIVSFYNERKAQ